MNRTLTVHSNLETLRKEAKRWLKAVRAGDAAAVARLRAAGVSTSEPVLRDVQFALAREHGLPGWPALRQALDEIALSRRSLAERAEIVLRSAWDGGDVAAAKRILARSPEVGQHDLCTAVATGNTPLIERLLAANPRLATTPGGSLTWEPILYLAYARLNPQADGVAIAKLLLEHGANANARFDDGWGNAFTVLTGVIGEGEGDRPPHPQARQLAELLIERGADPFDKQALYNTSITRDDIGWLEFLWARCEHNGRLASWADRYANIGGSTPVNALDYLLGNAVAYNHLQRAAWLLAHGANPNAPHAYSSRPLREEALIYGHEDMATLLVAHGASELPLGPEAAFQAACMRLDADAARALSTAHPEYLRNAQPMLTAARMGRSDIVQLLLDLGMDVDVADETQQRGLHNAAGNGAVEVARLLLAHGADVDRPTTRYGGPLGFAAHFGHRAIAELLAPVSHDVHNLVYLGMQQRVRELLASDATLANKPHARMGFTPLFALPDDEALAADMTSLLLEFGADPTSRSGGSTAEAAARERGLLDAADLMREAIRSTHR